MTEAGLSYFKTARLEYQDADPRAQEAFQDGFEKGWLIWRPRLHDRRNRSDAEGSSDLSHAWLVSRGQAPDTAGVGRVGQREAVRRAHSRGRDGDAQNIAHVVEERPKLTACPSVTGTWLARRTDVTIYRE